jgi:hypothetical protein
MADTMSLDLAVSDVSPMDDTMLLHVVASCAPPMAATTPINLTTADMSLVSPHLIVAVAAADALTCSGLPIGDPSHVCRCHPR